MRPESRDMHRDTFLTRLHAQGAFEVQQSPEAVIPDKIRGTDEVERDIARCIEHLDKQIHMQSLQLLWLLVRPFALVIIFAFLSATALSVHISFSGVWSAMEKFASLESVHTVDRNFLSSLSLLALPCSVAALVSITLGCAVRVRVLCAGGRQVHKPGIFYNPSSAVGSRMESILIRSGFLLDPQGSSAGRGGAVSGNDRADAAGDASEAAKLVQDDGYQAGMSYINGDWATVSSSLLPSPQLGCTRVLLPLPHGRHLSLDVFFPTAPQLAQTSPDAAGERQLHKQQGGGDQPLHGGDCGGGARDGVEGGVAVGEGGGGGGGVGSGGACGGGGGSEGEEGHEKGVSGKIKDGTVGSREGGMRAGGAAPPVFLVLPGIGSDSSFGPIRQLAAHATGQGSVCVVANPLGLQSGCWVFARVGISCAE